MTKIKHGFIINFDALIALSFVFFAMLIIASQNYNPASPGSIYLKQLSMDTVSVIEKTGLVTKTLNGNATPMQEVLESTPKMACLRFSIINAIGNVITIAEKSDCTNQQDVNIQTTFGPVYYNGSKYLLKSESWFRKEG
jgi:hypothetical protein